jgi:4-diphosphocytidyl-2-C-methyl-D-erythritol kinase
MISLPSFAKINLGLKIGARRPDGFHELRTIYQTLALHDVIHLDVQPGDGIEIRCSDPRVPLDHSNTCFKIAQRMLAKAQGATSQVRGEMLDAGLKARSTRTIIDIEKHLPVQGGLGAASSNAVATMLALERALGLQFDQAEKLRIAAEVGSDLPLFLVGGTVLGVGRGEEVYPVPDFPPLHIVLVTPAVGVSTPTAFARWDELNTLSTALTAASPTGTIKTFSERVFSWLSNSFPQAESVSTAESKGRATAKSASGVPAVGGDRAETPLLDLVRAGIENDFEHVVFPEHPELREVKELLQREGAYYASLSGSGSTLYGLFETQNQAQAAADRIRAAGHAAIATTSLTRDEYWKAMGASSREP